MFQNALRTPLSKTEEVKKWFKNACALASYSAGLQLGRREAQQHSCQHVHSRGSNDQRTFVLQILIPNLK